MRDYDNFILKQKIYDKLALLESQDGIKIFCDVFVSFLGKLVLAKIKANLSRRKQSKSTPFLIHRPHTTFRSTANSCLRDAAQAMGLNPPGASPSLPIHAIFCYFPQHHLYSIQRNTQSPLNKQFNSLFIFPMENALPLIVSVRKIPLILQGPPQIPVPR